jgi:putative peptidoglycan lipid II flippase
MLSVSLYMAIAKSIGAAKEMAVAAAYGTSQIVDAYGFLTYLLNYPVSILSSVSMTVFVPYLVRLKPLEEGEAATFKRELLGSTLLAGGVVALVAGCTIYSALSRGLTGLPPQTVSLANAMFLPMVLTVPLGIIGAFLAANVMAHHRQANTLLEGVPALCIFVVLLAFPSSSPVQLAWATLAGYVGYTILLLLVQPASERLPRPLLSWRSPPWRSLMQGFGVVLLGQAFASAPVIADQIMVAPLGSGAIASLGYASRVISLLVGLGATAIGRSLLPTLSELGNLDHGSARQIASRWAAALFLGGTAAGVAAWCIAPFGIKLLFQRGAFSAADTAVVVQAFRWGLLQLPFYFAAIVVVQLIASVNDYRKFLYIGVTNIVTKVTANFLLIPVLGIGGALLATSVMYAVSLPTLWLLSRK